MKRKNPVSLSLAEYQVLKLGSVVKDGCFFHYDDALARISQDVARTGSCATDYEIIPMFKPGYKSE